ncbi:MAG: hypothetical protein MUF21_01020 [Gemmatimonadaceae bacterium]|nr:hypothetical protein [Gemmatimonadaceae bacterium]
MSEAPSTPSFRTRGLGLPFRVPLLLTAVTGALASVWSTFETNDDATMMGIASGAIGDPSGDPHLIFMATPLGALLRALYHVTARVEWYGWLLLVPTVLGSAALAWGALALLSMQPRTAPSDGVRSPRGPHGITRIAVIAIAVAITAVTIWSIQFTRVALVLGFTTGVIATVALVRPVVSPSPLLLPLAALWLMGIWIRDQAAILGLFLFAPVAIATLWRTGIHRLPARRLLALAAVIAAVPVVHLVTEARAYASTAWRVARESHRLVYPIADYHLHRKLCEIATCARRTGVWSSNDLELVDMFTYEDTVVYSYANLQRANRALFPDGSGALLRLGVRLRALAGVQRIESDSGAVALTAGASGATDAAILETAGPAAADSAGAGRASILPPVSEQAPARMLARVVTALLTGGLVVFGVTAVLVLTLRDGTARGRGALALAWAAAIIVALFLFTKSVPQRVLDPIWVLGALATVLVAPAAITAARWRTATFLLGIAVLVVMNLDYAIARDRTLREVQGELRTVETLRSTKVVVLNISYPYQDIWRPLWGNADLHARTWLPISWPNLMPPNRIAARRLGLARPLAELPCRDDILLIGVQPYVAGLERFAREHGTAPCRFRQVHAGPRVIAYRGTPMPSPDSSLHATSRPPATP